MKKIGLLILTVLLLSGCSNKQGNQSFMITRDNTLYALYNQEGEKLTAFQYKTFKEVQGCGFIVTNDKDQKGFISLEGKEIIPFGEYETLESTDQMLYATKKDDKQSNSNLFVLDKKGEVLYSTSEKVEIIQKGLPIIHTNDKYIVLYKDGEVLLESKQPVTLAKRYKDSTCIVVGYENQSVLYDFLKEEPVQTVIKEKGEFQIVALDESLNKGIILYDKTNKKLVYIDRETQAIDKQNIAIDKIYYDEKGNIIIESKGQRFIYMPGQKIIKVNSYYLSGNAYLNRSNVVYGPHEIYKDGKKVAELSNCQLYPSAAHIQSEIYPVYARGEGYCYYNFEGKKVIDKYYLDAEPFDVNKRAIVKADEKGYSLINDSGEIITKKKYSSIQYIGSSYYAVYNDKGRFEVINSDGENVFADDYTSLPDQAITHYDEHNYMILGKNGRSYVYDIDDNMSEVFSVEGDAVLEQKGYYSVENEYYTLNGDRMK